MPALLLLLLLLQVVPDALRYAGQSSGQYVVTAAPQPLQSVYAMQQHSGGGSMVLPSHASQQRSLPSYNAYYGSPAAQSEHPLQLLLCCLLARASCPCPCCCRCCCFRAPARLVILLLLPPDASKQATQPTHSRAHKPLPLLNPPPASPPPCCLLPPSPAAARMARLASLERYRLKKARRGFGKKIRYQARKVNADKRPRVKVGGRVGWVLCVGKQCGWVGLCCLRASIVGECGWVGGWVDGWIRLCCGF